LVSQEVSEVAPNLIDADVSGRASLHAEALVEQRAIHAFNEAVRNPSQLHVIRSMKRKFSG
jgi:hypothetical protein